MFALRERKQLGLQFSKIGSLPWEENKSLLEFVLLGIQPSLLVMLNRDQLNGINSRLTKLLCKRTAGGSILDQDRIRLYFSANLIAASFRRGYSNRPRTKSIR